MFLVVFTTVEKREDGEKIAGELVERGLAGCVQILGPITSVYRWKGRVERGEEYLCIAKTTREIYPELEKFLKEVHPYEVPEIIALPIQTGSPDYLKWLEEACSP